MNVQDRESARLKVPSGGDGASDVVGVVAVTPTALQGIAQLYRLAIRLAATAALDPSRSSPVF